MIELNYDARRTTPRLPSKRFFFDIPECRPWKKEIDASTLKDSCDLRGVNCSAFLRAFPGLIFDTTAFGVCDCDDVRIHWFT